MKMKIPSFNVESIGSSSVSITGSAAKGELWSLMRDQVEKPSSSLIEHDYNGRLAHLYETVSDSLTMVMMSHGYQSVRSWSGNILIVDASKGGFYLPQLWRYEISEKKAIEEYLESRNELDDILVELPRYLDSLVTVVSLHLKYFTDEDEGIEVLRIHLIVDGSDDDQCFLIESHVLDDFFYPRLDITKGRLIFNVRES